MKKKFTFIAILMFGMAINMFAQTIVGTDPENRNVVLEEFTGIHCVYCPDGHAIAQAIYDAHPDDVVLINIHTGSFAAPGAGEPDFRTPWGSAIAGQSGLTGYPAGTVNRHLFPGWSQGSGTAMSRGQWSAASNLVMDEESYVNVALEATIIPATRQLSVLVEVYYTGDSPESTNLLNVAILQSNIFGPQTGGGAGNNYNHKHMLRHLLTGQWGVEISETTEGSFYTTTINYEIPADYTDVDVILEDLDIVAFVSETHQEVESGSMATITFPAGSDYDAAVTEVLFPVNSACEGDLSPRILIKNYGAINLTSADIEYSINNGDVAMYSWTGDLSYPNDEEVMLPGIPFDMESNNTLVVTILNPNGVDDENPANNTQNVDFEASDITGMNIEMQLFCGAYAGTLSWEFYNGDGELLAGGSDYVNNEVIQMELPVDYSDCYTFILYDQAGDGFSGGGYLKLKDDGTVFAYITDELSDMVAITFQAENALAGPADFDATIDDLDINFTWTAASKGTLLGYNIFLAEDLDTPINTSLIEEETYTYTVAGNGSYEFYLTAEYEEGTSDIVGPVMADINVGINGLSNNDLNIYPNPVSEIATLSFNLNEVAKVQLSVYSLVGALVMEIPVNIQKAGEQNIQINTSSLDEGIYFVNLKVNNQMITKKITVMK